LFSLAFALLVLPFARTFCPKDKSNPTEGQKKKSKQKVKKASFVFIFFRLLLAALLFLLLF
jgi:hypothetical protein